MIIIIVIIIITIIIIIIATATTITTAKTFISIVQKHKIRLYKQPELKKMTYLPPHTNSSAQCLAPVHCWISRPLSVARLLPQGGSLSQSRCWSGWPSGSLRSGPGSGRQNLLRNTDQARLALSPSPGNQTDEMVDILLFLLLPFQLDLWGSPFWVRFLRM